MRFIDKVWDAGQGLLDRVIPRPGRAVGGVGGRGVLVEIVQGPFGTGNRKTAKWHGVTLRIRRADEPDGAPGTTVTCYLDWDEWLDLQPGRELPVRVDPGTGTIIGLDTKAFTAESDLRRRQG